MATTKDINKIVDALIQLRPDLQRARTNVLKEVESNPTLYEKMVQDALPGYNKPASPTKGVPPVAKEKKTIKGKTVVAKENEPSAAPLEKYEVGPSKRSDMEDWQTQGIDIGLSAKDVGKLSAVGAGLGAGGYAAFEGTKGATGGWDEPKAEATVPSSPKGLTAPDEETKTGEPVSGMSFVDEAYMQNPTPVQVAMSPMPKIKDLPAAPDVSKEMQDIEKERLKLQALTNEAATAYKLEKDDLKKRELWSGLVQAIGMLAAGAYGLKHNLDMSGVKFNTIDWIAKVREARDDMHNAIAAAEKDYVVAKGINDARVNNKLQDWTINSKIIENANKEANNIASLKFAQAREGTDVSKFNVQMEQRFKELQLQDRRAQDALQNAKNANEVARAKLQVEGIKDIKAKYKEFDKGLKELSAAQNKGQDTEFLGQKLKGLNAEIEELTGSPVVPPEALEETGGIFGYFKSAPEAADIEKAKRAPKSEAAPPAARYSEEQEAMIQRVVQQAGISREQAIEELIKQNYL